MSDEQKVDLTFREAITELGQIVEALESNKLELEESLVKYERGIVLIRFLRGRLENAQQRVDVLKGELGSRKRKPDMSIACARAHAPMKGTNHGRLPVLQYR